ncbi:ZPR1 zinc finger domain-containing protein [Candidatus Woesearchaeota archaeon]|nr:ZPR1 zinc finger domain-containing protein [Candidatus Woesearchaeota archaeon]
MSETQPETVSGEMCPFCNQKTLTLMESKIEVPYFGEVFMFSMSCSNCHYHKADIEAAEPKDPTRYTLEVSSEEDMKIRIVKASSATIKIPNLMSIEPGEAANGYVTNVEGILNRMKHALEIAKETDEEEDAEKARNLLKKINKVIFGSEKIKIIIEDPTGNSAIISDKAVKEPLKVKK